MVGDEDVVLETEGETDCVGDMEGDPLSLLDGDELPVDNTVAETLGELLLVEVPESDEDIVLEMEGETDCVGDMEGDEDVVLETEGETDCVGDMEGDPFSLVDGDELPVDNTVAEMLGELLLVEEPEGDEELVIEAVDDCVVEEEAVVEDVGVHEVVEDDEAVSEPLAVAVAVADGLLDGMGEAPRVREGEVLGVPEGNVCVTVAVNVALTEALAVRETVLERLGERDRVALLVREGVTDLVTGMQTPPPDQVFVAHAAPNDEQYQVNEHTPVALPDTIKPELQVKVSCAPVLEPA